MYLFENLVIEDDDRFHQAVTSSQCLVIVSDRGLRNKKGFSWLAASLPPAMEQ